MNILACLWFQFYAMFHSFISYPLSNCPISLISLIDSIWLGLQFPAGPSFTPNLSNNIFTQSPVVAQHPDLLKVMTRETLLIYWLMLCPQCPIRGSPALPAFGPLDKDADIFRPIRVYFLPKQSVTLYINIYNLPSQIQRHFNLQICLTQPCGRELRKNVCYQKMEDDER